ncbi:MAG: hypothetical protein WAS51_14525 [Ilumatobacteraceae bacterium]
MTKQTRYNARLVALLKQYIPNDEAVVATMALVNIIRTTRQVMITLDKPLNEETRMDVLQMLVDVAMQLPTNDWYIRNAGPMSVAFRMGAQGFLDSAKLMQREQSLPANVDRTAVRVRVLSVANLWREIPIIAMALVRRGEDLSELTVELREELAALDD